MLCSRTLTEVFPPSCSTRLGSPPSSREVYTRCASGPANWAASVSFQRLRIALLEGYSVAALSQEPVLTERGEFVPVGKPRGATLPREPQRSPPRFLRWRGEQSILHPSGWHPGGKARQRDSSAEAHQRNSSCG